MLKSAEDEILNAHKYTNIEKFGGGGGEVGLGKPRVLFSR